MKLDKKALKSKYAIVFLIMTLPIHIVILRLINLNYIEIPLLLIIIFIVAALSITMMVILTLLENPDYFAVRQRKIIFIKRNLLTLVIPFVVIIVAYFF